MESFYVHLSVYTKQGIALKVSSDWLLKYPLLLTYTSNAPGFGLENTVIVAGMNKFK